LHVNVPRADIAKLVEVLLRPVGHLDTVAPTKPNSRRTPWRSELALAPDERERELPSVRSLSLRATRDSAQAAQPPCGAWATGV
jgi:hypothetical protein